MYTKAIIIKNEEPQAVGEGVAMGSLEVETIGYYSPAEFTAALMNVLVPALEAGVAEHDKKCKCKVGKYHSDLLKAIKKVKAPTL